MLHVSYKKKYVATYKEIAIMFISFSIVLLFLYPKDMLKKQILSEKSNYDLSMLYLKNMLKNDDSNEELMLILARQSLESGNKDLSFKLLELLKSSKNEDTRAVSYFLSYQLAKEDYYYLKEKKMTQAMEKKYSNLQELYKTIIKEKLYKGKDIENLYKEASFLHDTYASKILVQKLLLKKPHDLSLLSDAFYIARKNGDNIEAVEYIDKLVAVGVDKPYKWNEVKFNILLEDYNFIDAENKLLRDAKISEYWHYKLATFYLYYKRYKKASDVYMIMYKSKDDYQEKKELFIMAIKALQAGGRVKDAAILAHKYENYFFKEGKMRILLLKIYITANDLKKARNLSKRMLKARSY